jgi:SagB-type dehydrogenase family enzyme
MMRFLARPSFTWRLAVTLLLTAAGAVACTSLASPAAPPTSEINRAPAADAGVIALPYPRTDSDTSLEAALLGRRSVRSYQDEPLILAEIGQLLWAAQGVTDPARGYRTAPSAGALYPLEVYLIAGKVEGLPPGVYRYGPGAHNLTPVKTGDQRDALYEAALRQAPVRQAPAVLVIAAVTERTTGKYGERGIRYVHMEAGHAAQNALLQAVALGLGAVVIGAFEDDDVRQVTGMPAAEQPLYLVPVGKPG